MDRSKSATTSDEVEIDKEASLYLCIDYTEVCQRPKLVGITITAYMTDC